MLRKPAVAGKFYPGDEESLRREIAKYVDEEAEKEDVLGVVSPHAGYVYSGAVAGHVLARARITDTVVILAPNHTGMGKRFAIWESGVWTTPLGNVSIDEELTQRLLADSDQLAADTDAHYYEHSVEVQLPFLQYLSEGFRIAPIIVGFTLLDELQKLGQTLASAISTTRPGSLVIASSDMTHREPQESARKKDQIAIDEMLKLDEVGLYDKVTSLGITMCGIAPAVVMLTCCKQLGAKEAYLAKYQTSGDVTGDYGDVVGYAAIVVK